MMLSTSEMELLANISGSRAFENVSVLISPPERVSGSQAEAEGANKVRELLLPYMDSCELEGVAVTGYLRGTGKLEVISPIRASFLCQVNPVTGSGKGEGILIDVSGGSKGDYERGGLEVRGKIALATGEPLGSGGSIRLIAREAKHRGASCLVYHLPAREEDVMSVHGINIDFPVLSISNQSAVELHRLLSQYKEVRVSYESNLQQAPGTSYNVVGTIWGSQFPEEVIYVTSHHDTWFHGANDNNATTACLLELANLLAKQHPKRSIRFVIHGSEESGAEINAEALYWDRGSYAYTELHRSQLEGKEKGEIPVCVINGEMLGYSPRSTIQCTPELLSFINETVGDLREVHQVIEPGLGWTSSDHLCYHTLGIPTIYLIPGPDPRSEGPSSYFRMYHTEKDNLEHISVAALESNSKLITLLVNRLDVSAVLPHSLQDLTEAAGRGLEIVPNSDRIKSLLKEKKARCSEAATRQEKIKKTLEFARVVHKNIYCFAGLSFIHKFTTISDTVSKIKEACRLIDDVKDLERAREVLLSVSGAALAENFSHEVQKEWMKMTGESPLLNRLSNFPLDLSPVFIQIAQGKPEEAIFSNLESIKERVLETARTWGITFEESLIAV